MTTPAADAVPPETGRSTRGIADIYLHGIEQQAVRRPALAPDVVALSHLAAQAWFVRSMPPGAERDFQADALLLALKEAPELVARLSNERAQLTNEEEAP